MENTLYFGDNLDWLQKLPGNSVDLIYLDPPFNSKRDYNLLYKTPAGHKSEAQVQAFTDTWSWDEHTERQYAELLRQPNTQLSEMIRAFRGFLREGDVMAYLVMMARRMVEMHRVLKDTGSLYLHCDPTASHYLKILLDAVFGPKGFKNEIVWKRTSAHSSAKKWGPVHDLLYFYSKSSTYIWNSPRLEYEQAYLDKYYRFDDGDGRLYWRDNLCAAGTRNGSSGMPWRGINPTDKGMHWKFGVERLDELDKEGRIYWPPKGTMPQYKRYRDELKGKAITDVWEDVDRINPVGNERLGYPTQKPLALLERIIAASSNPGDVVLDPFCGCGTAVHAAQKLGRKWIGIDITVLAIDLIERRLRDAFPGIRIHVEGLPTSADEAAALAIRDKDLFQDWAVTKVGGQPYRQGIKGADGGIDGLIYFEDGKETRRIIVSIKGGANIGVAMVRDLNGLLDESTPIGIFVCLTEPTEPMRKFAAAAGFYSYTLSNTLEPILYPRLQLLSVADIFDGKRPRYPGMQDATFFKAKREKKGKQQGLEL